MTSAGPDPLRADVLARLLPARRILARDLRVLESCASTQDEARAAAAPGLLIAAERQTGGRGRRARDWWTGPPASNLAITLCVDPPDPPPLLGVAGAVALADTLDAWGAGPAQLKWPNDVLLGGCKVAGLLGELLAGPTPCALLGIGVNVHAAPPAELTARPAVTLAEVLRARGRPAPDRTLLLAGWLWRLEAELARVARGDRAALEERMLARLRLWAPRGVREGGAAAAAGGPLLEFSFARGLAWRSGGVVLRRPLAALGALEALP
jgi:BirA family biotin operon repressor/biotin-[acetyl-CoA-carboxylase] ligase